MPNPERPFDREMVMQTLNLTEPSDSQIIDMLMLLVDDWEIRAATMRCIQRRPKPSPPTTTLVSQVNGVTKEDKSS